MPTHTLFGSPDEIRAQSAYSRRVRLEDILLLPTEEAVPDNEALLRAAQRLART
jgi:hypothetical protein